MSSGLGARVLTALVLVPLVVGLLGWGPWWGFPALAVVGVGLATHELLNILLVKEKKSLRLFGVFCNLVVMLSLLLLWSTPARFGFPFTPSGMVAVVLLFQVATAFFLFARGGAENQEPVPAYLALFCFGILYTSLLGSHVALLSFLPKGKPNSWVFLLMFATFMGDTTAYFFGRSIGGPKVFPAVSPNKTWAGVVGCMVGGTAGAFLASWLLLPVLLWWDCLIIGIATAILGQIGDFSESLMKRAHKVKDSGSLLPGHGGILDRIDALLFNGPFIFYYATWVILVR
ncbi:MAG: phosphatidate cytidylyltransferase [Myxococcales bacterium]|nr:phosphatidate cytidylyltransferase [Myxococcales bacterium]